MEMMEEEIGMTETHGGFGLKLDFQTIEDTRLNEAQILFCVNEPAFHNKEGVLAKS